MKAQRQIKKEAALRAITHGHEQPRKLPEVIELARSQALALVALNNDEQRLMKQAQDTNAALEATRKARVEVLGEVCVSAKVTIEEIGSTYRFDGEKLFRPTE